MIKWNDLKHLDVKDIDVTKIDLTKIDLTRFDVRNLAKFDLPKFETPELDVDVDRVFGLARDTAYAGIGVAVITAQKLDTRRRELNDQITARVRKVVAATT